jgi:hypothetical protein
MKTKFKAIMKPSEERPDNAPSHEILLGIPKGLNIARLPNFRLITCGFELTVDSDKPEQLHQLDDLLGQGLHHCYYVTAQILTE